MKLFEPNRVLTTFFLFLFLIVGSSLKTYAGGDRRSVEEYKFYWSGQIAGFIVSGRFSYDAKKVPANGIVREEDLLSLDVSFYDPQGNLLRTYADNHLGPVDENGDPYVNFAFDTLTKELLQDGTWDVDDDDNRFRNGFTMGEGSPALRSQPGSQTGLAFWSRSSDTAPPHIHVDDWNDENGDGEFGFPIGFSSHEDVAFLTKTTQNRIDDGRVGPAYYLEDGNGDVVVNNLASHFEQVGKRVKVLPVSSNECKRKSVRCLSEIKKIKKTLNKHNQKIKKIKKTLKKHKHGK